MIPMISRNPLPRISETIVEMVTARSRILMIGSSKFSRYCFQSDSRTGGVMAFTPNLWRNSATWDVLSPALPGQVKEFIKRKHYSEILR